MKLRFVDSVLTRKLDMTRLNWIGSFVRTVTSSVGSANLVPCESGFEVVPKLNNFIMTSDAITVHERIELIKILKQLVVKSAQVIVQSRDGNKIHTKCNPNVSGHGSFNLGIRELVEVDKEVRRVMSSTHGERWSLCIEIYVKTLEGVMMTLEMWNISLVSDYCDSTTSYAVYNRLTILLKSLLAITRVIPGYRYARQRGPETFDIGHKMYIGDPQCGLLGEKYQQLKVGSVSTPIGTIQLVCNYRTVMTISTQPSGIDSSIMLNSDHFRADSSPKHDRNRNSDENNPSLNQESNCKIGAFVESRRESLVPLDNDPLLIPDVPFGSLLNTKTTFQQSPPSTSVVPATNGVVYEKELCDRLKTIDIVKDNNDANANLNATPVVTKSTWSCNDDFIVVDLVKPPFVESTGNIELGTFYQEWKSAPPLQTCPTDPKVIDQVGDLTSQLASYETSSKEFDNVVTSLCDDEEEECETESPASRHFVF